MDGLDVENNEKNLKTLKVWIQSIGNFIFLFLYYYFVIKNIFFQKKKEKLAKQKVVVGNFN